MEREDYLSMLREEDRNKVSLVYDLLIDLGYEVRPDGSVLEGDQNYEDIDFLVSNNGSSVSIASPDIINTFEKVSKILEDDSEGREVSFSRTLTPYMNSSTLVPGGQLCARLEVIRKDNLKFDIGLTRHIF